MQKLIVRNFGPVQELDLEIKDLMLFIGEQATGKSTVAKLVYFFKKEVKDALIAYLYSIKEVPVDKGFMWIRYEFFQDIQSGLLNIFRATNSYFQIDFRYKENRWLHIDNLDSIRPRYSVTFTETWHETIEADFNNYEVWESLYDIFKLIIEYRRKYLSKEWALSSVSRTAEHEKKEKAMEIETLINDFFGNNMEAVYVPASRSMLAALSERLPTKGGDMIIENFRDKIADMKPAFRQSFHEIIEQKKLRGNHLPPAQILDLAIQKIREILKGEYRVDEGGEKIYFNGQGYVDLSMASSGQQEALWILLQLFILILNREKVFLVIEEPEAHLFPQAQKSLVELIALLFNENNSQVLITTHSPYILTSFNNLIYAGNVGKQHEKVSEIIPENIWLDTQQVGAYRLGNGIAEDLMDEETQIMRVEEIDAVSESINEDFDAILNLELQ